MFIFQTTQTKSKSSNKHSRSFFPSHHKINMTARSRILTTTTTTPTPEPIRSIDNDFVVILAALLCALICVLGLVAVTRCSWIRRLSSSSSSSFSRPSAANKGLKKKVLNSLPKFAVGAENEHKMSEECAICLAEFETGEEVRVLPQCGHGFHVGCIDTWLGSHSSCPSCRQILVVARCHKCGDHTNAAAIRPEPREPHVNTFLP